MKAAVVTDFQAPLEIRDVLVRRPAPDQVLVRIETCGICHTDIHAAHGDWPVRPTPSSGWDAAGRARVIAATRKLDEVNQCFTEVLDGRVTVRLCWSSE